MHLFGKTFVFLVFVATNNSNAQKLLHPKSGNTEFKIGWNTDLPILLPFNQSIETSKGIQHDAENYTEVRPSNISTSEIEQENNETTDCPDKLNSIDKTCLNLTVNNSTENSTIHCFDDNLPCHLSREEYMEHLYEYLRPGIIKWILILSHSIVFLIGLVGNALVCLAVYANYSMRTITNVFIVNLAVADFLVILVCLPPTVVWDVTETWFLGETMCKLVPYFQTVSVTVSVLTLTSISIDRWYAICFPLRYRTKISRAITIVSIIWMLAIVLDIPEFLSLTVKHQKLRFESVLFSQCITTWDHNTERNYFMAQLVLLFILPLLLMIAAYFKIATVLWTSDAMLMGSHQNQQRSSYGNIRSSPGSVNRNAVNQLQARRKAAKMMVVVVIMFAVCYSPVHIFNLLRYSGKLNVGELTKIFALCCHWLCYANSAINPVIYNFMSGKFRREFRNVFIRCHCSKVRIEDNCIYKHGPSSRHNNSLSMRSYNNLSVRNLTKFQHINQISERKENSIM